MTGELILTDYEKGYLLSVYDLQAVYEAKEYIQEYPTENFWYMQVVGDRTFDMCIYLSDEDDIASDKVCVVYECHPDGTGCMTTDTSFQYYLRGKNNYVT